MVRAAVARPAAVPESDVKPVGHVSNVTYLGVTMLHLIIDDHVITVPSGYTLLQAACEHGVAIPTLCYLETLAPYAACGGIG